MWRHKKVVEVLRTRCLLRFGVFVYDFVSVFARSTSISVSISISLSIVESVCELDVYFVFKLFVYDCVSVFALSASISISISISLSIAEFVCDLDVYFVRLAWVGSLRVGSVRLARADGEPKADGGKKTPVAPPAVCGISNAPRLVQKKRVKPFRATEGNGDEKARIVDFALSARAGPPFSEALFLHDFGRAHEGL